MNSSIKLHDTEMDNQDRIAKEIHYPECWDLKENPTLQSAYNDVLTCFGELSKFVCEAEPSCKQEDA